MFLSKYNLKRNQSNKKNVITFVCTCNSQKRFNPKVNVKKLEEPMIFDKNCDDNSSTITISDSELQTQIFSSQSMEPSSDQIDDSLEKNFLLQKRRKSKERQIKRHNIYPCTFRIKFKFNQHKQRFQFVSKTFPHHNHPPSKSNSKVSDVIYIYNYICNIFYMIFIYFKLFRFSNI